MLEINGFASAGTKSSTDDHAASVLQSGPSLSGRKRGYEHINGTDGKYLAAILTVQLH